MRTLVLVLALLSTPAFACPKGPKEDKLSLAQVMINFGRFVNPADLAALQGMNSRDAVTDADLVRAVEGLAKAIDCADTVLNDHSGDLYPSQYKDLPEDQRVPFLQLFFSDLDNFRQGLASYKRDFAKLQGVARDQRDFSEVDLDRRDVDDLANTAHEDIFHWGWKKP